MTYYTKEHEWLKIDGDTVVVGISVHAADELGDITYVELPETGSEYSIGDVFSVVESVKAASDIYSPLAGSVIEANEALEDSPELVNEDAEGKGWICKFKSADIDTSSFMTADQYKEFLA